MKSTVSISDFGSDINIKERDDWLIRRSQLWMKATGLLVLAFGVGKLCYFYMCVGCIQSNLFANVWNPFWAENAFFLHVYPWLQIISVSHFTMMGNCIQLVVHVCNELLIARVEHLNKLISNIHLTKTEEYNLQLNMCIAYHVRTINLNKEIKNCFAILTTPPHIGYAIIISISLINILMNRSPIAVIIASIWTATAFIQSHAGQRLKDTSVAIGDNAYNLNWYDGSVSSQKKVLLLVLTSQRPLDNRVSGLGGMSYPEIMDVCKKGYSLFAIFLKMK